MPRDEDKRLYFNFTKTKYLEQISIDKSKGGKIVSFSKYDVVAFMASRLEEPVFGFYKYDIEDRIEKFSKTQYDVALMSLEEFLILTKKRKVDVDR